MDPKILETLKKQNEKLERYKSLHDEMYQEILALREDISLYEQQLVLYEAQSKLLSEQLALEQDKTRIMFEVYTTPSRN